MRGFVIDFSYVLLFGFIVVFFLGVFAFFKGVGLASVFVCFLFILVCSWWVLKRCIRWMMYLEVSLR